MPTDWVPRVLRVVALTVCAVCGVAMVIGWFPGMDVYRDTNDCFGRALGALFSAHGGGGHRTCEPHYVYVGTRLAGGWNLMASLAPVVLGGLALWRWPKLWLAWVWPVLMFALLVVSVVLTLDFDIFSLEHKVPLWPSYVVSALMAILALVFVVLVVAVPIIALVRWRARRRAARERVPEARVV